MALKMANREAFGRTLVKLGETYPNMVVLDSDVCTSTRTCLFKEKYPDRFIQMGVAEQNMICAAAGMSTVDNLIPWVSTFAVFTSKRALDQVSISVAYPRNNVKINGSYGGIPTGKAGATHQSVQDIAIMRSMPNMTVIVPVDAVEVEQAMIAAMKYQGPVYLRTTRHESSVVLDRDTYTFEWCKSVVLRDGRDVTLIGTGVKSVLALDAAEVLQEKGIDARVIHMHTIKPIDEDAIVKAAEETMGIVTMENHSVIGGLGGAVAEVLCERHPALLRRLGFPDVFGESGDIDKIFRKMGLSVDNVVSTVQELLSNKR